MSPETSMTAKERHALAIIEVRRQVVGYIVAALSLVAGLAWNDAIKSLIEFFIPASQNTVWAKIGYAVFISIVIVGVSGLLMHWNNKKIEK